LFQRHAEDPDGESTGRKGVTHERSWALTHLTSGQKSNEGNAAKNDVIKAMLFRLFPQESCRTCGPQWKASNSNNQTTNLRSSMTGARRHSVEKWQGNFHHVSK